MNGQVGKVRGYLLRPTYGELLKYLSNLTEEELNNGVIVYDVNRKEYIQVYLIARTASPPIPMGCFDSLGFIDDNHVVLAIGK